MTSHIPVLMTNANLLGTMTTETGAGPARTWLLPLSAQGEVQTLPLLHRKGRDLGQQGHIDWDRCQDLAAAGTRDQG